MPLVERYNDWNITDGSFDDPHTLRFDHRIDAGAARNGAGLARVEDNAKATCVITTLKPEFGWTQVADTWFYDPAYKGTDLGSIWRNDLPDCVQHDKKSLKDCFCNATTNPDTAYVGPEAEVLSERMNRLEWPSDKTELVSRFAPASQYVIGPKFCSAYHLGDGYVGTAGHCSDKLLANGQLEEMRVVFGWNGDVVSKKTFTDLQVFEIERVVLCDTHGPAPPPTDMTKNAAWSGRWDSAILKLRVTSSQLYQLKSVRFATRPPKFGSPVYNIGCPLGTQLKVSVGAHVLRHYLEGDDENPFSRQIAGYGTFTTDLDQFEGNAAYAAFMHPPPRSHLRAGNSGGPVFDAATGYIVGHTSSTQNAVAESDVDAIESWATSHGTKSNNHALIAAINDLLKNQEPANRFYRVHQKFLRILSGKPRNSPLVKCVTNVCPGDFGPNKVMQTPGTYHAVFGRHRFDSKDVYLRNVTARVERGAIFMTPLGTLLSHYNNCLLTIKLAGRTGVFGRPDASSALIITNRTTEWSIYHLDFHEDTSIGKPLGKDVWSVTLDLAARRHEIPPMLLHAPRGLIHWTKVLLEQSLRNPPLMVGLQISLKRPNFPFPVSKTWPPERPDVTDAPEGAELRWPEETFEFATTAGETSGAPQTGGPSGSARESNDESGTWTWEAPIDRVWTNPRQPSHGLRDPFMDDIDELLA